LLVSFTDMIDGSMARTRDQITTLGKMLDPVADKLLFALSGVFLLPKLGYGWLLAIVVGLEMISLTLSVLLFRKKLDVSSNLAGKIKLNFQVFGILFFLIAKYSHNMAFAMWGKWLLLISIGFFVISTGIFINRFISKK
jgi:CDP-diacylglycerol---glycerol-3-phosphate 3-phosphatidyltransferase